MSLRDKIICVTIDTAYKPAEKKKKGKLCEQYWHEIIYNIKTFLSKGRKEIIATFSSTNLHLIEI